MEKDKLTEHNLILESTINLLQVGDMVLLEYSGYYECFTITSVEKDYIIFDSPDEFEEGYYAKVKKSNIKATSNFSLFVNSGEYKILNTDNSKQDSSLSKNSKIKQLYLIKNIYVK